MRNQPARLLFLESLLFICLFAIAFRLHGISRGGQAVQAGVRQGQYHLHIPLSGGVIYDRHFAPLNQSEPVLYAVVNPTPDAVASVFAKLDDRAAVTNDLQKRRPFLCKLKEPADSTKDLIVLNGTENKTGILPAQHLLGYIQNGKAASGLEKAYAPWLETCSSSADITFSVDANGTVLSGAESSCTVTGKTGGGVVTTLDADIQQIAESALAKAAPNAGAAIVLDCNTGTIAACASTPVYDPDHLADAINQPDAPFLNRALSAYSVGSVFKLVTAANALEQGFTTKYLYDCTGDISFYGQRFRCHDLNGHGLLDMQGALIQSCNPYFISLSRLMSPASMHDTAEKLGFGSAAEIANGLYSAAGYLPSVQDLEIEAERANMSFGQGKLLATPLQIAAMTACIGNDGIYTPPQLIAGLTADGSQLLPQEQPESVRVLSHQTAFELRRMMTAVLEKSKKSKGKPSNVRAAGKTSTAQTGQFAPDGTEYCHAWMTGFFPVYQPQYAVTVFVENGGSGNEKAAPLFREIIEQIVELQS